MNAHAAAKRFYKSARARAVDDAFAVALDDRLLKTTRGASLRLPTQALAEFCATEWDWQGDTVVPASMPVTQLCFAAIDWTAPNRAARADYIVSYGETDLCCHRAESPAGLVERQGTLWDPIVAWGARELGVSLHVVTGIVAAPPPVEALETLRALAARLDDFELTALSQATGLSGSVLIGFALLHGHLDAARAYEAAVLDDLWSIERWGEDTEARARLDRVRAEFDALGRFIAALAQR